MNIKIDLNINANEELANALLTLAALMNNTSQNFTKSVISQENVQATSIENTESETSVIIKALTLEDVREKLASLSQSGKQKEVKALITKYGAKKLTDIDPASYEDLLKEAKVL